MQDRLAGTGVSLEFVAPRTVPAGAIARAAGARSAAGGIFRMMRGRMPRRTTSLLLPLLALAIAVAFGACGEQKIQVAESDPAHRGAQLFKQRCSGCHSFEQAGARGSAVDVSTRERSDGPNFDTRRECVERVLYAIANGGFSGAIMPANIVVGEEAQAVAEFVSEYAGRDTQAPRPPGTGNKGNGYRCTAVVGAGNER
jgi:mono/diheme cytochrome c family protein